MRRIEILNKSYQNPNLHVPIAKLNNKTLYQVFILGNMLNEVTFVSNGSTGTISKVNGYTRHTLTNSQSFNGIVANITKPANNDKLFIRQNVIYPQNDNNHRLYVFGNANVLEALSIVAGIEYVQERQYQNTYDQNQFVYYDRNSGTQTNGMYTDRKEMYIINQTVLGIQTLTLSEISYWYKVFNYYQNKVSIPGINYPALYIPTEPTGLGNRYNILQLNKTPYGQELEFDNVQLNLLFGLSRNAYDAFKLLMEFIIDNECILEYDYGQGVRYTDVRLINAPKTEMEQGKIIRSKFDFKRITPFYTILQGSTVEVIHTHDWKIKPIVEGTVNTNTVYIEAEDLLTTEMLTVKFDFTSVTKPFDFYYNAETKQILINGVNIGYKYIDLAYGKTFLELEKDIHYEVTTTGITNPVVTIKKWVID